MDEFDVTEETRQEISFLEELRISSFVSSKMSQTMTFSDIEMGEEVSTRVYEDAFPNELSEFSNVENYLIPAISGAITSQTVDLSAMFGLSHSRDGVPVEFDKLTTIENGEIVTENLLTISQSISFPGTYSYNGQGFDSYAVEAIKSKPAEGTYWVNELKSSSLSSRDYDGYYLYLDTSDDSIYETVIVMDKRDNIVGIGFDYDLDSKFHPGKTLPVEKDIIWSENYNGDSIADDYIHFRETDKEVGVFNEPTFSDVLFDVSKMAFSQSSELIELAEEMAANSFEEQTNLAMDVFQQYIAGMAGTAGMILGSSVGMPTLGFMLGYLAASIPYQIAKIIEQENYLAHRTFRLDGTADEKVLGEKFWFDDMYGDVMPVTMFGSFGGVYAPVYGQTEKHSYSADVIVREFNVEESKASSVASPLFSSYSYPKLDYWLSTRNLAGYSDFDEPMVIGYLQSTGEINLITELFGTPEYNHAKSSTYYIEDKVREETSDNDDSYLNTIVPTIDYDKENGVFSPRFSFVDSVSGFPAPEFYTEYPVVVSEGSSALEQHCSIYKLVDIDDSEGTTAIEIQLFDAESALGADIVEIDAYLVWTQTTKPSSLSGEGITLPVTSTVSSYVNTMVAGEFEVDLSDGTITISSGPKLSTILDSYVAEAERLSGNFVSVSYSQPKILFQVKVEKYRSISDVRDLTSEQVNKIATAQAIEAAIFEYNYQFNLGTQTQLGFSEIVYTTIVTAISTALCLATSYGVGSVVSHLVNPAKQISSKIFARILGSALQGATSFTAPVVLRAVVKEIGQELLLDPWIESTVSGLVRRAGGDAIMQMVLSSVAESGREALTGPLTNLFNPQSSQQPSFIESKYFSKELKTVQDVLTAFNEYKTEIKNQQEQRKEDLRLLGVATKVLSFVSLAIEFTASQFLGPVGALVYSTLATYCFSEDISLKKVFHKAFNPVMVASRKVGDAIRNNKGQIVGAIGIGVIGAMIGVPIAGMLAPIFGSILGTVAAGGITMAAIPLLSLTGMVKSEKVDNKEEIIHYNRWLSDRIKTYLDNLPDKIKYLFDPYSSFSKLSGLFGLSKSYIIEQRQLKHAKKVIAQSVLDSMGSHLKQTIEGWVEEFPALTEELFKVYSDLISFIDDYQRKLKPKPSPRYQMYSFHPNFKRDYFSEITSPEQAYWLGFIVADGYISLEHKKSGDFYRMGIGISEKDIDILFKFCESVGLNPEFIKTREVFCSFTGTYSPISEIRWGDQGFAKDLLELGIQYEYKETKGQRIKIATMPNFENRELALAYLLGFYDGDGSLGLNHKDNSIYPTIGSTNKEFLYQIKKYFGITSKICKSFGERYDHRRDVIVKSTYYTLYLEIPLFKNMLENYGESLERKRVSLERLEHYGISSTRYWLKKVFTKDILEQMLEVMSPNKIGKMLGIKGETIVKFAKEEYGISVSKSGGEYQSIQHSLRNLGEASVYYKSYFYWSNFLGGLEKDKA